VAFEGGEIRGVKRVAAVPKRLTREQCLEALQRSRFGFAGSFDQLKEVNAMRLFDTSVVIDCRDPSAPWNDWGHAPGGGSVGDDGAGFNAVARRRRA